MFRQVAYSLPVFPGFEPLKTRAAWPVWSDSTTNNVTWPKVVKDAVIRWYHQARAWNARKQIAGRYGGDLGSAGLRVLESLMFDFQNYRTGRLDPSYEAIAAKTGMGRSTVAVALARLRRRGLIHWQRRSAHHRNSATGRFELKQMTNAYALLPPSQWRGYQAAPEAPPPDPGTWGDHPPMPEATAQAMDDYRHGASLESALIVLEQDENDTTARALARLFRAVAAREQAGKT